MGRPSPVDMLGRTIGGHSASTLAPKSDVSCEWRRVVRAPKGSLERR
jgi:hypothetical protein